MFRVLGAVPSVCGFKPFGVVNIDESPGFLVLGFLVVDKGATGESGWVIGPCSCRLDI